MTEDERKGRLYYLSRKDEIFEVFGEHAGNWRPFLEEHYSEEFADAILNEARMRMEKLTTKIPYIGGDDNPMTRHLIRSATSLALYQAMKAHGKSAREASRIIYEAVVSVIRELPLSPAGQPPSKFIQKKKKEAERSQEQRYADDWVWEFVEGEGKEFDYGYNFYECGVDKFYQAQDAEEFLPYYCFLDFVTARASGQKLMRTMTLAEGGEMCDFRFVSMEDNGDWPPPFPEEEYEN